MQQTPETVTIVLRLENLDEAVKIAELLGPWRERVYRGKPDPYYHQRKTSRQDKLLAIIPAEPLNAGQLYRRAKMQGYALGPRVFRRDMASLVIAGLVHARKVLGGHGASTVYATVPISEKDAARVMKKARKEKTERPADLGPAYDPLKYCTKEYRARRAAEART